jgi:hypothetical protein
LDTSEKMDMMLCERVLDLYREVEKAIEIGSGGYAKEKLKELNSLLKDQRQHSAFRGAYSRLPRASTNPYEWKMDLLHSRISVEEYERKLKRSFEQDQAPKKVS